MTTAISADNTKNSFFLSYYFYRFKLLKIPFILSIIFSLLSLPVFFGTMIPTLKPVVDQLTGSLSYDSDPLAWQMFQFGLVIAVASFAILFFITVLIVPMTFNYHNRKDMADLYGALPLTVGQRFWADFLAGLTAGLLPFIICALSSLAFIPALYDGFVQEKAFIDPNRASSYLAAMVLALIVFYLGVYIFSTLITVSCGNFSGSVLFSFLFLVLIPLFALLVIMSILQRSFGQNPEEYIFTVLRCVPPIGTFTADVCTLRATITEPVCAVIVVLILAAALIGSYHLATKRGAEKVGEQFAYNSVYHVISVLLLAVVFFFGFMNFIPDSRNYSVLFTSILFTIVPLLILEVIHYRGFKKLWKSAIKYFATALGSFIIVEVLTATNGMGLNPHIAPLPDRQGLSSAVINYWGTEGYLNMIFDTPEELEAVYNGGMFSTEKQDPANMMFNYENGRRRVIRGVGFDYKQFVRSKFVLDMMLDSAMQRRSRIEGIFVPSLGIIGRSIDNTESVNELLVALQSDIEQHFDDETPIVGFFELSALSGDRIFEGSAELRPSVESSGYSYGSVSVVIRESYENTLSAVKKLADNGGAYQKEVFFSFLDEGGNGYDQYPVFPDGTEQTEKLFSFVKLYSSYEEADKNENSEPMVSVIASDSASTNINSFMLYIPEDKQQEARGILFDMFYSSPEEYTYTE